MSNLERRGRARRTWLLAAIATVPCLAAAAVTRGPYLQSGTPESVIVRWRTDTATSSRVSLGVSAAQLDRIIDDPTVTTEHVVRVSGLAPATRYYYAVGSTSSTPIATSSAQFFQTAPPTGDDRPIRIWAVGDSGRFNSGAQAVYASYRTFAAGTYTNLWLMLGDNAYVDGTDAEYQAGLFGIFPELLRQTVLWPSFGNHDGHSASSVTQTGPYYDIFSLPRAGEAGGTASGTEAYYSFDYGNVHFVVLDSYDSDRNPGSPMLSWLEADLQANQSDWVIAYWHHPPYSKGSHDSDTESYMVDMRTNALPILERHGVDLVLTGHSHDYERSKFIDGHYGLSTTFDAARYVRIPGSGRIDDGGPYSKRGVGIANAGAVYVVAGAGSLAQGGLLDHPAMHLSLNELGSVVIDVAGLTMNVRYLGSTGAVRDYFTMVKGSLANAPSSVAGRVWRDTDGDGLRESGESPLPGIEVRLIDAAGGRVATTVATADGSYRFDGVALGHYCVQVLPGALAFSPRDVGADDTIDSDANPADGRGPLFYVSNGAAVGSMDAGLRGAVAVGTTVAFQDGLGGYAGTQDSQVASKSTSSVFGGAATLHADGSDATFGRMVTLMKWNLATKVPTAATVTAASLTLQVSDLSNGRYNLVEVTAPWSESSVNWNRLNPTRSGGVVAGTVIPNRTGSWTVQLNAAGVALVQGWANGTRANNGLMLIDAGTGDGVDVRSSEFATAAQRPKLTVTYR